MNTEFIKSAIDAFENFVAACGNDVCNDASEGEYVVFNGQIATDNKGNVKTYALINNTDTDSDTVTTEPKKVLVAQAPLRPILHNGAEFLKTLVDLYEADQKEAAEKAEKEAKEEAEAAKAENEEIENKISDLQSEISSLKLRKKSVRHYVKSF